MLNLTIIIAYFEYSLTKSNLLKQPQHVTTTNLSQMRCDRSDVCAYLGTLALPSVVSRQPQPKPPSGRSAHESQRKSVEPIPTQDRRRNWSTHTRAVSSHDSPWLLCVLRGQHDARWAKSESIWVHASAKQYAESSLWTTSAVRKAHSEHTLTTTMYCTETANETQTKTLFPLTLTAAHRLSTMHSHTQVHMYIGRYKYISD